MTTPVLEKMSSGVAVGAVTSPWWLEALSQTSHVAALLLPILGTAWLVVQMVAFVRRRK